MLTGKGQEKNIGELGGLEAKSKGFAGKCGIPILGIMKSDFSDLLVWMHADGTIIIFDSEKKRVVDYQIGHCSCVAQ